MGPLLVTLLLVPRPVLSGAERIADTPDGRYRVHYTLESTDAVRPDDVAPKSGVPDDVEAVLDGLSRVTARWVDQVGLRAPLPDDGDGGDARIDVYLRRLPKVRGRATVVDVGANSPATSAFLEVDANSDPMITRERLAAAAGHEAFHAIQYAYRPPGASPWLHEASATYVEAAGFQDARLKAEITEHFRAVLAAQGVPFDAVDGKREFDTMVLVKFLIDRRRDVQVLRSLWEAFATSGDHVAAVEAAAGRPIVEVIAEWASWNALPCNFDDDQHYDQSVAGCGAWVAPEPTLVVAGNLLVVGMPPLSSRALRIDPRCAADVGVAFNNAEREVFWTRPLPVALAPIGPEPVVVDGANTTILLVVAGRRENPALTVQLQLPQKCITSLVDANGCRGGGSGRGTPRFPSIIIVVGIAVALLARGRCARARRRRG